jgi:hypothetical protein
VCDDAFGRRAKTKVDTQWASTPATRPVRVKRNHITPKQAGGCNDPDNVVPDNKMGGPECDEIETLQETLEQGTKSLI